MAEFPAVPAIARIASVGRSHLAVLLTGLGGSFVVVAALDCAEVLHTVRVSAPVLAASDTAVALVGEGGTLDLHDAFSGRPLASTTVKSVVAISLRQDCDGIDLAAAIAGGGMDVIRVTPSGEIQPRASTKDLHDGDASCLAWTASALATGGCGRELLLMRTDDDRIVVSARLARWLRCEGAKVSGLRGDHERALLLVAGAQE